jgi:phosphate/sulfate permease
MFSPILISLLVAMFFPANMGASGTSAAFLSAYGSNLIRKDLISGLFGIFVFIGAIVAGEKVTLTIGKGILPESAMNLTTVTIILVAIGLSMFFANMIKVPQTTS